MHGYDTFQKRADTLVEELADFYFTIVDAARFQTACSQLFEDMAKNIIDFKVFKKKT